MTEVKGDHLCLQGNRTVQKMLEKYQTKDNHSEKVLFSDFVIKINRKDKEQTRVLLVTEKAIYNLMPNNYGKCKRRIDLKDIMAVSLSSISDEFALHVPEEYDYRFKSAKKEKIAALLAEVVVARNKEIGGTVKKLNVQTINQSDLKDQTVTKAMARMQERADILRRIQQLGLDENESDKEDKKEAQAKPDTEMMDGFSNKGANNETVTLNDFELLKVLGRGAFGKVMQVKKKSDGKIYAMKILKKRAIIARNQVEHTKAERKILQALDHPFLMTLRYAFQSKEKLYLVLDYITGGELFFHLKNNRRFPEDVAKIWVGEIALAFGHLHSLGVIYRDLKPENILLDNSGHVILTDFGLAKDLDPKEKTDTFCGTPEYLAPEIVTGVGHDKMVDWWSLGILLYELTVGIPPFYSQNVNEMYNKIQHGVLRFPPFLSEPCKALIVALLNRDPKKRLGGADDVNEIKSHPFFKGIAWDKLMRKEIDSGFKPKVKGDTDTDNFEDTFTNEPVVDSVVAGSALSQDLGDNDQFGGFTFTGKAHLG